MREAEADRQSMQLLQLACSRNSSGCPVAGQVSCSRVGSWLGFSQACTIYPVSWTREAQPARREALRDTHWPAAHFALEPVPEQRVRRRWLLQEAQQPLQAGRASARWLRSVCRQRGSSRHLHRLCPVVI